MASAFWKYQQELEGELARLGVDLRDADDPDSNLTLRRIYVLFHFSLPPDNAVSRAAAGITAEDIVWGYGPTQSHILANIFDAIQSLTYLTQAINTPKNASKPKVPKEHPRPGMNRPSRPRPRDWFPGKTIISQD